MSLNKVQLIGHVGKDPEIRRFEKGGIVARFSLATKERGFTTADGKQIPESTEWHNIVVWAGKALFAENHIQKGSKLYIEGRIQTRSYEDKDKQTRYITEIITSNLLLLDRKKAIEDDEHFPF